MLKKKENTKKLNVNLLWKKCIKSIKNCLIKNFQ